MRRLLTAALVASTFLSAPAFAQSSDDIVMRRPLPGSDVPDVPSDPEGPVTPIFEPPIEPPVTDPGDPENPWDVWYDWDIGDWNRQPECGQQATITRPVRCVMTAMDEDWNFTQTQVPFRYCQEAYDGYTPAGSYTGSGGNCPYNPVVTWSDWSDGTCSADSTRYPEVTGCQDAQGRSVDVRLCQEWADYDSLPQPQQGNYESCSGDWVEQVDKSCNGPVSEERVTYVCQTSDGTVLPDSVASTACDEPKPLDTTRTGRCYAAYSYDAPGGRCGGTATGNQPITGLYGSSGFPGAFDYDRFCEAQGATCCEIRWRYNGSSDRRHEVWAFQSDRVPFTRDHSIKADGSRWNLGDPLPRYDVTRTYTRIDWLPEPRQ